MRPNKYEALMRKFIIAFARMIAGCNQPHANLWLIPAFPDSSLPTDGTIINSSYRSSNPTLSVLVVPNLETLMT